MSEPAYVPQVVRVRLITRFGPEVADWCDALPELARELAARWDLELLEPHGGGTSRVFRCLRRGTCTTVWLKLTPDPAIAREESEALRRWAETPSVVGLLAQDLAAGALLLEAVIPGRPAKQLPWRLTDVATMLRDLRDTPLPGPGKVSALRPLTDRVEFLFALTERRLSAGKAAPGWAGPAVLDRARTAALELSGDGVVGLVHGDLHPANVLSGEGGRLVAIDPRPAWGDPDFDAVDWVLGGASDLATLRHRAETLATMVPGQSADRVLGWCRATAALIALPRVCAGRNDAETRFILGLIEKT